MNLYLVYTLDGEKEKIVAFHAKNFKRLRQLTKNMIVTGWREVKG